MATPRLDAPTMHPMNVACFAFLIHTLCTIHSASVTSWIRTAKRNAAVGGGVNSRHLIGMGCDCVLDDKAKTAAFTAAARALGLQVADEGDHIHIEFDDGRR